VFFQKSEQHERRSHVHDKFGKVINMHAKNTERWVTRQIVTLSGDQVVFDRLRTAGKAPKVARCAAWKLLHIGWAVATKGQRFDPHYHERPPILAEVVTSAS
jgi:hypothetical protein